MEIYVAKNYLKVKNLTDCDEIETVIRRGSKWIAQIEDDEVYLISVGAKKLKNEYEITINFEKSYSISIYDFNRFFEYVSTL